MNQVSDEELEEMLRFHNYRIINLQYNTSTSPPVPYMRRRWDKSSNSIRYM